MKTTAFIKLFCFAALLFGSAPILHAQEIIIAAPMSGTSQIIGNQVKNGADAFSTDNQIIDDKCIAEGGKLAAETAIKADAQLLIGLPCIEALEAARDYIIEQESDIRIIALGVELAGAIGDNNPIIYRLAPDTEDEATAMANYVRRNWREDNFAIIDDGTLYGRLLAQNVRAQLEADNLIPVFVDNYRPLQTRQTGLVRRLQRSGATHVIVGGDSYDAAIIGADAQLLNVDFIMLGGSAFRAPPDDGELPDGTLFATQERLEVEVSGSTLRDFEVLTHAALTIAHTNESELGIDKALKANTFETILGSIRFNELGGNNRDWYTMFEVQNGKASPLPR